MGIFGFGASLARTIFASGVAVEPCPVRSEDLLNQIVGTLRSIDSGGGDNESIWNRYGSNAAGSYDYQQLNVALRRLSPSERVLAANFMDDHPNDCRAAGTAGRAIIDMMNGNNPCLLPNMSMLYDKLDIDGLHDDYWYYPLEVIRGVETLMSRMQPQEQEQVVSLAIFTLVCAVSIGGMKLCAEYTSEGALVLKDSQIRDFVSTQSFDASKLGVFVEDHAVFDGDLNIAMIEGYFDVDVPSSLRNGFL